MTHFRLVCQLLTVSLGAAGLSACGEPASEGTDGPASASGVTTGGGGSTGGSQGALGGATVTGGGGSNGLGTGGGIVGSGGSSMSTGGATQQQTGGTTSTGGASSTGGTTQQLTGGSTATGGISGQTGGTSSTTGGTSGQTGGTTSTGGISGQTGGTSSTTTGGTSGQTGGATSTGGTSETTGGTTSTGGATEPSECTFDVTVTPSSAISTVGIVEFTTSLAGVTSATIDYGPSESYGAVAPVTVGGTNRTLLLGNKPSTTVHLRVAASNGASSCQSDDYTFQTGQAPNGTGLRPTVTTNNAAGLAGGFKVTSSYTGGWAFILDADGTPVWWYQMNGKQPTRALMSYDGRSMWVAHANVGSPPATMHRVSMDGLEVEDMSSQFVDLNHDFAVLPDETVAFGAYVSGGGGTGSCDRIMERSPDGQVRTVVANACTLLNSSTTHFNAIHYDPSDDTIVFSTLDNNSITKVDRSGNRIWTVGGSSATLSGATWERQHGFHILASDHLLIFNNGMTGMGGGGESIALEILLNPGAGTSSRGWEFGDGISNTVMGDVQRLANGNTLVTYSMEGIVQEVDANGSVLEELDCGVLGYMTHRASLYGPPPM